MLTKEFLARPLKNTFSPYYVFFFSQHQANKEFLAFIKATIHAFVILITCALFSVDWLADF